MISIIMPVVDKVQYTRECLQTLRLNTVIPKEIIIIDNGQIESSACLVEEFRDLNLLYIKTGTNLNVNPSWNLGLVYSSKPYMLFLNNDTLLNKYFIQKILYVMENVSDTGICIPVREITKPRVELINKNEDPILVDAKYIEGWAFTIRRSLFDKIGPIPDIFKTYMGDTFLFEASTALGYRNLQMTNCSVFHYGSLTVQTIYPDYRPVHRIEDSVWRKNRISLLEDVKRRNQIC